jgi:alkylated DNA repair dioxygenase AlkB
MMSPLVHARPQHHVDNDYCGDYVAGVTLLSPRVMEFRRKEQPIGSADGNASSQSGDGVVRMLVEPRSFYVMRYTPPLAENVPRIEMKMLLPHVQAHHAI